MATIVDSTEDSPNHAADEIHRLNGATSEGPRGLSRAAISASFWRTRSLRRRCEQSVSPTDVWEAYWRLPRPKSAAKLCRSAGSPWAWGVKREALSPACRGLLRVVDELARGQRAWLRKRRRNELRNIVAAWLDESRLTPPCWQLGVGHLAAAGLLSETGKSLGAALGWRLLDHLYDAALQAAAWRPDETATDGQELAQQTLAGELPLALSYYFAEMAPLRALRDGAKEQLREGLFELLNGEGLVKAPLLPWMRGLAACWTRCRALGGELKGGCWTKAAGRQFGLLVEQCVRWSDATGGPLLASEAGETWPKDFLRAALHFGGRGGDIAAARKMLGSPGVGKNLTAADAKLPKPSYECEWSSLAVMRATWAASAPIVAVDYSRRDMPVDVRVGRQRLLGGPWQAESRVNGKPVVAKAPWEQLCWFSDKDVDYLELVLALEGGASVERQILLARRDGFLLLVDHLQNPEQADLRHTWELPLAPGVEFTGELETRDGLVSGEGVKARAIPLALPEWRIDPRGGELSAADGRLRLAQQGRARALACPLFVDLQPRRVAKPSTWRQLTVAESLAIQPADVAVGYRVQCGKRQWLMYRSQGPRANRTVLGQNTSSEFLAARFIADTGGIESLVEIEG